MARDRRHHNVFTYYRGPSRAGGAEEPYDQQLEDNATKALINTLEYAGREVTSRFLARFAGIEPTAGDLSYHLQRLPSVEAPPERRILLGLATRAELPTPTASAGKGRVDGAITAPADLLVAIETKIGDAQLDGAQMMRHSQDCGVNPATGWRAVSWADVYRWALQEEATTGDPLARFLLGQLVEFQRSEGLAPFTGFEMEDFRFFAGERSEERQAIIKARLRTAWRAVSEKLDQKARAQLGEIVVHNLRMDDENASAQTLHADETCVNLTIEITDVDVQLDLVAWTIPQVARFEPWLRSDGVDLLREQPLLSLVVYRRYAANYANRQTAKVAIWRRAPHNQLVAIPGAAFQVEALDQLLAEHIREPKWEKPAYHVRRSWPAAEAVELGDRLCGAIADDVRLLLPIVTKLNG